MEFADVKPSQLYYAVTEGQFIGVYYVIEKRDRVARLIVSYYGGDTVNLWAEKNDYDWVFEFDEDEEPPSHSWLSDSQHIKRLSSRDAREHYIDILKYVFEVLII